MEDTETWVYFHYILVKKEKCYLHVYLDEIVFLHKITHVCVHYKNIGKKGIIILDF